MRRYETLFIVTPESSEEELKAVATKVQSEALSSAAAWGTGAVLSWILVLIAAWKASRPPKPYRPMSIPRAVTTHPPGGRLTP